jgi:hypothetical protein
MEMGSARVAENFSPDWVLPVSSRPSSRTWISVPGLNACAELAGARQDDTSQSPANNENSFFMLVAPIIRLAEDPHR